MTRRTSFARFLSLVAAVPLAAHHSTAPFDMTRATTVSGVVVKFLWVNPHAYIFLDAMDEKGETQRWSIEIESPNGLRRAGWAKDTLKPGDKISCIGARAKDPAVFALKCFSV